ncbi:hypothetical protein F4802DRAFT_591720 [Xylaria palmicola]|nr:hypothetical protein F4802DRAFT_591720 [Xylaria palmicola]
MTPASSNADTPPSDIIGRVLVASERLIELLDVFGKKLPSNSGSRPCENSDNQRTLSSIVPTRYKASPPGQPNNNLFRRQLYSLPYNLAERRFECDKPTICSISGLPVLLSFLTSYVGLLSVYRTIFFHIQDMLRTSGTQPSTPGRSGPQPKRMLISQPDGSTMLDRIRLAWASFIADPRRTDQDENRESSKSCKAAAMSLLQSMLMHEGFDCRGEGFEIGLGSLEVTLDTIRRILRGERL